MSTRVKDITGRRFGRLVVKKLAGVRDGHSRWLCICDCGKEKIIGRTSLISGTTASCRCLSIELTRTRSTKHGFCRKDNQTPEHRAWIAIRVRCYNPGSKDYHKYGAKGITVCRRWRRSFTSFMMDMGSRPSDRHSIDRINGRLGYCKRNCRWATITEQNNNKATNHFVRAMGKTQTLAQWGRETGIPGPLIGKRISAGWSAKRAVTEKINKQFSRCQPY